MSVSSRTCGNYRANEKTCPFGSRTRVISTRLMTFMPPCANFRALKHQEIFYRRDSPAVQRETAHAAPCITLDLHFPSPGLGKNWILQRGFGIFCSESWLKTVKTRENTLRSSELHLGACQVILPPMANSAHALTLQF